VAKVLVIDDHDDTRELIRVVLEHAGHDVTVAADGDEGLHHYRTARPDLVVVDIFMPRLDGMGLIASLRAETGARAKILAISAGWNLRGGDVLQDAARRGADRVLRKPLDLDALIGVVKDLLASP
jgi:two-component system, chemotaxis family, chemotaxis protein CheY